MAKKQTRRTITVNRATSELLAAHSAATGIPISTTVERILAIPMEPETDAILARTRAASAAVAERHRSGRPHWTQRRGRK